MIVWSTASPSKAKQPCFGDGVRSTEYQSEIDPRCKHGPRYLLLRTSYSFVATAQTSDNSCLCRYSEPSPVLAAGTSTMYGVLHVLHVHHVHLHLVPSSMSVSMSMTMSSSCEFMNGSLRTALATAS